MDHIENLKVLEKFKSYPKNVQAKLLYLRRLILEVAVEILEKGDLEEALKWGEPSYLSAVGSTIRIDWKAKNPDHYAIFFHCKTKLIDTFKEIYPAEFTFEDNRAIVFHVNETVPEEELKHCIALALQYHKIKHLPMLGV